MLASFQPRKRAANSGPHWGLGRVVIPMRQKVNYVVVYFIKGYQFLLSPILPERCRFFPSCSSYTLIAVERYGGMRGLFLGLRRLLRCHPLNDGGYDPVP